jgi:hypothetical protein
MSARGVGGSSKSTPVVGSLIQQIHFPHPPQKNLLDDFKRYLIVELLAASPASSLPQPVLRYMDARSLSDLG